MGINLEQVAAGLIGAASLVAVFVVLLAFLPDKRSDTNILEKIVRRNERQVLEVLRHIAQDRLAGAEKVEWLRKYNHGQALAAITQLDRAASGLDCL